MAGLGFGVKFGGWNKKCVGGGVRGSVGGDSVQVICGFLLRLSDE